MVTKRSKSKPHPTGGGRKPRAGSPATSLVAVRLTEKEHGIYRAEAEGEGVSLGEWIRAACALAMSAKHRKAIATQERS